MFKTKLEKLDEQIERNLPETVRLVRKFYFEKISGGENETKL